jgi:hypothetical protein
MDNFIEVYKGVFNDEFCNNLIQYFKHAEEGGMTSSRQDHDEASKLNKEDLVTYIPSLPMKHTDINFMKEFNRVFWDECYKQYAEKFSILQVLSEHNSYTMKIQKTKPGQGYHIWHCENGSKHNSTRILAWTVYLNDDFEAGETEFLYQQYRYKPSKGDVVIFPAAFTHTHRGNPPIGGDKYIITGWVEF